VAAPPPKQRPPGAEGGVDAPPGPLTVEVAGVEYDDPGVGKHDGTHQGERLFTCPQGFGSFVKAEKVELGISMQTALATKYFDGLLPQAASKSRVSEAVDALGFTDSKGREKAMAVEFVGRYGVEQRQQRLEGFVEIALAETNLETRYPEDVWEGDWCLPNLKSLWLDKTLLHEWADVRAICEKCPCLEWLSLAKLRLQPLIVGSYLPEPRGAPVNVVCSGLVIKPYYCRVKTLVLNGTGITWDSLRALDVAGVFPQLENLHLAHNDLTEGVPDFGSEPSVDPPFSNLRSLVLDANGIKDWRVLQRACTSFPKLEQLHLNMNLLGETLDGLAEAAADQTPRRLVALFLNENRLSSWRDIGALSSYSVLELKAQRIPLTDGDSPLASPMLLRQIFIALMPTVMRLNASEVTGKERVAAERYFLGLASQDANKMIAALRETCNVDCHATRLRGIHGEVVGGDATEEAQAHRSSLVHSLVQVSLRPVGGAILDQPTASKRLPHTMTVGELKRLCQTIFKQVPFDRIRLQLADSALPFGIPLDDEARELGFYGVGDGAEIRVDDAQDFAKAGKK